MATNVNTNPIIVEGTGTLKGTTIPVTIQGIKVIPSNTTWTFTLTDAAGNIIYNDNANAGDEQLCLINCTGLICSTWSNMTRALIYLAPSA